MPEHTLPHWLATLDADALADLLARRPDVTQPSPVSLVALAERLSTTRSVRLALEQLNRTELDVLTAAQAVWDGVTVDRVVDVLTDGDARVVRDAFMAAQQLALLWPAAGDTYRLVDALRGFRAPTPVVLHREPPAPVFVDVDVDTAAGMAVLPTLRGVAALIDVCSVTPMQLLRAGGIGVKELRRVTKALGTDEVTARLWLALAYHADLLDNDDGEIVPTVGADEWLAASPAARLTVLARTWWELPGSPTTPDADGKLPAALAHAYDDGGRRVRHEIVGWLADRQPGAVDLGELLEALRWRRPSVFGDSGPFDAAVAEAHALGVLAGGGLSAWGRALATGGDVGVAERWLPEPTGSARLQADLTAVVTGMPTGQLAAFLDLVADIAERDTASVWRFSPASVRRALDAGRTADELLDQLRTVASHGLPQPLEYLVRDVARRHGEVRVVPVGCCLVASDAALLAEIAAHRGLAALRLRLLGDGVLASARPVRETVAALRQHGYAPVAVDKSGAPVVERVRPRRVEPRPHYYRPAPVDRSPDLFLLASTLLDAGVVETRPDFGAHLPANELLLLRRAIEAETPVEIQYVDMNERRSRRVITPYSQAGDLLEAWCHMRDDERHFLISRIERVAMAPAMD
ncbi:MAG TPA: helicase-associated domain-containing protein [Pseudonocardiaceae bacterium]|nr:helicase-associated domain-containing protein [Pseudonocardiaceae bacterium]